MSGPRPDRGERESGRAMNSSPGVRSVRLESGAASCEVGSATYRFEGDPQTHKPQPSKHIFVKRVYGETGVQSDLQSGCLAESSLTDITGRLSIDSITCQLLIMRPSADLIFKSLADPTRRSIFEQLSTP